MMKSNLMLRTASGSQQSKEMSNFWQSNQCRCRRSSLREIACIAIRCCEKMTRSCCSHAMPWWGVVVHQTKHLICIWESLEGLESHMLVVLQPTCKVTHGLIVRSFESLAWANYITTMSHKCAWDMFWHVNSIFHTTFSIRLARQQTNFLAVTRKAQVCSAWPSNVPTSLQTIGTISKPEG